MIKATITGLPDMRAALRALPINLKKRVLRNALAAAARPIRDAARSRAPVLQPGKNIHHRTPGLVKRSIVVRTSKDATKRGNVGVFVNVRPAKGARAARGKISARASQRGAKSKLDPFYWRFLEFGTKHMRSRAFLTPAAAKLGQALRAFTDNIGPQIRKLNDRFLSRR